MSDISVIGLGVMGSALARTLLESGRAVTVWNRTAEKAEPLASAGASVADTAAAAVAASPATIVCIASHDQTIELLSGFADSLRGKTIIELSTGGAEEAEAGHPGGLQTGGEHSHPELVGPRQRGSGGRSSMR